MPNLVPGFTWHPIDVGNRAARRKGRGLIGHVAVSGSTMLVPSGTAANRNADWHFYLPKVGPGFQFIDLDLQCWASMAGNGSCAAFESQGGLGTTAQVNAEPWTPDQIENAARILAHMNKTEGVPLQDMRNSLPGSRGFGVHRYGIDPWRIAGGEMWSNPGKLCPGDTKVSQVPQIVARAIQIVNGSPTPTVQEDDMAIIEHAQRGIALLGPGYYRMLPPNEVGPALQSHGLGGTVKMPDAASFDLAISAHLGSANLGEIYAWLRGGDPVKNNVTLIWEMLKGGNPAGKNNFNWLEEQDKARADALAAQVGKITPGGTVDPVALAKALLADDAAVAKLGDAIAAGLATRVHNG